MRRRRPTTDDDEENAPAPPRAPPTRQTTASDASAAMAEEKDREKGTARGSSAGHETGLAAASTNATTSSSNSNSKNNTMAPMPPTTKLSINSLSSLHEPPTDSDHQPALPAAHSAPSKRREDSAARKTRRDKRESGRSGRITSSLTTAGSVTTERLAASPTTLQRSNDNASRRSGGEAIVGAFAYTNSSMPPSRRDQKTAPQSQIASHVEAASNTASAVGASSANGAGTSTASTRGQNTEHSQQQPSDDGAANIVAARIVTENEDPRAIESRLRAEFQEETERIKSQLLTSQGIATGEVVPNATLATATRVSTQDSSPDDALSTSENRKGRRRWLWISLLLLLLAGGIGTGVAVATSNDKSSSDQKDILNQTESKAPSIMDGGSSSPVQAPTAADQPKTEPPVIVSGVEVVIDYEIVITDGATSAVPAALYVSNLTAAMDILAQDVLSQLLDTAPKDATTDAEENDTGLRRHHRRRRRRLDPMISLPTAIKQLVSIGCSNLPTITQADQCMKVTASMDIIDTAGFPNIRDQFLAALDSAIRAGRLQMMLEQVNDNALVQITGSLTTRPPTASPVADPLQTLEPTNSQFMRIRDLLYPLSGELLNDPSTPQFDALFWISEQDARQQPVDTYPVDELRDRYVATLLYFATDGNGWSNQFGFLSAAHICEWREGTGGVVSNYGIFCTETEGGSSTVVRISLENNDLMGTIPSEIRQFQHLQSIELAFNSLSGPLPQSLGMITGLRRIVLNTNRLTGTIPPSVTALPHLEELHLYNNNMNGNIPTFTNNTGTIKIIDLERNDGFIGNFNTILQSIPSDSLEQLWCNYCWLDGTLDTPDLARFTKLQVLALEGAGLDGSIPSVIGSLTSLFSLNLRFNEFSGNIPAAMGSLSSLSYLDLSYNELSGSIPPSLASIPTLQTLTLAYNSLSGSIPSFFNNSGVLTGVDLKQRQDDNEFYFDVGQFFMDLEGSSLVYLSCDHCILSGSFPKESLQSYVNIGEIHLSQRTLDDGPGMTGSLPDTLGFMTNLSILKLNSNSLTGSIPSEIGNLVNLVQLSLGQNLLVGTVPFQINLIRQLRQLEMWDNSLSGQIPTLLGNDGAITVFDFNNNAKMTGTFDDFILKLPCNNLQRLHCVGCALDGSIPTAIGRCQNLRSILMERNSIGGSLPTELGEILTLKHMNFASNLIVGSIPTTLGMLQNMQDLALNSNRLEGIIPQQVAALPNLQELILYANDLSGSIPSFSENIGALRLLDLEWNSKLWADIGSFFTTTPTQSFEVLYCSECSLSGSIPTSIGQYSMLAIIDIGNTKVFGSIPQEIGLLATSLTHFNANSCSLQGEIPMEISYLTNLVSLDLGGNNLSGRLPPEIGDLPHLGYFALWDNADVTGTVPTFQNNKDSIYKVDLNGLDEMVLDLDAFFAQVPTSLQDLQCAGCQVRPSTIPGSIANYDNLRILTLSSNGITGTIPSDIGMATSLTSIDLSDNKLNGTIPPEIGTLPFLAKLTLGANNLVGQLPSFENNQGFLFRIDLNWNGFNQLGVQSLESFLDPVKTPTSLVEFKCRFCGFGGTIPDSISEYSNLQSFIVEGNLLRGNVPAALADLPALVDLELEQNDLVGTIPPQLCAREDDSLAISADCSGPEQVVCDCCELCWSDDAGAYV